jgi:MFS family permease
VNASSRRIQRIYLLLLMLQTLAASLIWGINTLFLLDAGLSNTEAFAANAFFTAGMVIFEVPTGVLADTRGRRASYLLGTLTLSISTLLYLLMWRVAAPFWTWAIASALLGLGFTFFSGAFEAWLVDALAFTGYFGEGGKLESVLARGQIVEGGAMVAGATAGGVIAQASNLAVPYLLRALVLVLSLVGALVWLRDLGFTPERGKGPLREVRGVLGGALRHGLANPPVRWVMLSAPFSAGVAIYAFYAMQPYLLQLYGDPGAYSIAGVAAALVGGAQIVGGLLVPHLGRLFRRRTSVLLAGTALGAVALALMALAGQFWVVIALAVLWGLTFTALLPVREAYLNALVPSRQRATVLSFDSLLGSSGAVVIQPALGRSADAWGYPASYACGAAVQVLALPVLWLARRERATSDPIREDTRSRSR